MSDTKNDKVYEVVHAIRLMRGKTPVTLERGAEVRASEIASDLEDFLKSGTVRDPETATPTTTAMDVAHDRLSSIAQKLGLVKFNGADYHFGAKKVSGLAAFRKAVSIDELEAAIVAAATKA